MASSCPSLRCCDSPAAGSHPWYPRGAGELLPAQHPQQRSRLHGVCCVCWGGERLPTTLPFWAMKFWGKITPMHSRLPAQVCTQQHLSLWVCWGWVQGRSCFWGSIEQRGVQGGCAKVLPPAWGGGNWGPCSPCAGWGCGKGGGFVLATEQSHGSRFCPLTSCHSSIPTARTQHNN